FAMADYRFVQSSGHLLNEISFGIDGVAPSRLLSASSLAIFGLLTLSGCAGLHPTEKSARGGIVDMVSANDVASPICNRGNGAAATTNATVKSPDDFPTPNAWTFIAPDTPDGRGGPKYNEAGIQWWTNPNNPNTPASDLYRAGDGLRLGLKPTPASQ